jgi:MOSC domain-containing protein YiiM
MLFDPAGSRPAGVMHMGSTQGQVLAIHITARAGEPLHAVQSIRAVPASGLEGDRYFNQAGTFSRAGKPLHPSQEATLIEIEALEGLEREHGLLVSPSESRRNILTRGIDLNALVGCEFQIGDVLMKGVRLCHPCDFLESKTSVGVKAALANRGGLRAQILTEGVIRVGDAVVAASPIIAERATAGARM